MTYIRAWMSSKFGKIRPQTRELHEAALEHQNKSLYTYSCNGENDVSMFSRLFFIHSFSYLQVTKVVE